MNQIKTDDNSNVTIDPYVKLMKGGTKDNDHDSVRFSFELDVADSTKATTFCVVKSSSHSMLFDISIDELEEIVKQLRNEEAKIKSGKYH